MSPTALTNLDLKSFYDDIPFEGSILESIKTTFSEQALALNKIADNFNDIQYQKSLSFMVQCKGHVIVSGMGKSGLIGRKLAATLASTGTPSFFLHPGEAFHGDLGMITKDDVVILISNSGETDEVLQLIPSLKSFGNPIISICNNTESTMALNSDSVLDLMMEKETCPNNLAPTTSTTLTLVVGDALAVALMHKRGFQPNDFAKYHPGGSLGRRLLTRVKDQMVSENLPFVSADSPMSEVVLTMTQTSITGLAIVVDKQNKLLGVISDGDIRRLLAEGENLTQYSAKQLMTENPYTVLPDTMLGKAIEDVAEKNFTKVLVVNKTELVLGVLAIGPNV
ncbi:KpsF/GutQ family sugar-phosphate isomerase [Agarivorans sp. OAG1]|uniref:KpsF/GutQ family sugar-phosphate isomerase n=1 Tax=Agarivorans sp. OAG1 TaxID=3082387 RepID=UPI0030CEB260